MGAAGTLGVAAPVAAAGRAGDRPDRRKGLEGQRLADLGDGRYRNPVLAGDRPDPNVLKDGDDYFATFSSFERNAVSTLVMYSTV